MPAQGNVVSSDDLDDIRHDIVKLQEGYNVRKKEIEKAKKHKEEVAGRLKNVENDLDILEEMIGTMTRMTNSVDRQHNLVEQAQSDFIDTTVGDMLRARVPFMAHDDVLARVEAAGEGKDRPEEQQQQQQRTHDTVLVSYVTIGSDDFQVAFRIDKDTLVDHLHRDACSYWGCSHNDYVLCRIDSKDDAEALWGRDCEIVENLRFTNLQDDHVLDPAEKAHLHLVRWEDLDQFKQARQKVKEQEHKILQDLQANPAKTEYKTIKTMNIGAGHASNEPVADPYIEALRPWPGLHSMLKIYKTNDENRQVRDQKWVRVKCHEIFLLCLVLIFSCICHRLRSDHGSFWLRNGVIVQLADGTDEWVNEGHIRFDDIKLPADMWRWLGGTFAHQFFNSSSSFRRFYTPVGFMQIRQQRANQTECPDRTFPDKMKQNCYYVDSTTSKQEKYRLVDAEDSFKKAGILTPVSGRQTSPSPFVWQEEIEDGFSMYGFMNFKYSSDGYKIVYDSIPSTLTQFREDLPVLEKAWVVRETRVLFVECTVANYNYYGGHVSINFVFEISPSGAVRASKDIMNFAAYQTEADDWAEGLDVVRWILIIGWFCVIRWIFTVCPRKTSRGKQCLSYFFSANGIVDLGIIGCFCGAQYVHLKDKPTLPQKQTALYSYASLAFRQEQASVVEAVLILLLLVKLASYARMNGSIYRFFKTFGRSLLPTIRFAMMFIPILFGCGFLAHAIWSAHLEDLSTWALTWANTSLGIWLPFGDIFKMREHGRGWTIPFLLYFLLVVCIFMLNVFLAIVVHAYWEVELVEKQPVRERGWSSDQWLDWAMWGPVYSKVTGKKAGSSQLAGYVEASEESEEGSETSSDEERM